MGLLCSVENPGEAGHQEFLLKPQKDSNLEYSALTQTSQHHMHEEKKQKRPLVLKSSLFSHHPMWQEWVKLSRRPGLHRENSTLTG